MSNHGSRSKAWHEFQNFRGPALVASLFVVVFFLVFHDDGKKIHSSVGFTLHEWNEFDSVKFNPTVEFRNGTDVIWQIPDSPKAVLFIAHGCDQRAAHFWDKSAACPNCDGMPEDRLLVLHALAKKFAVLTISSAGRCWSFGNEMHAVKNIIEWWLTKNKLEKLPVVALGASSGGYFVSALANTNLRLSSINIMIAEGVYDRIKITENYPPTLFVHMPKDSSRRQKISEAIEMLKGKHIDVAEIECMEFPLSSSFLADRIPGLDQIVSAKLLKLFQDRGFIDGNGYMKKDGRATKWKAAVRETKDLGLDESLFQHVQEELNLAFAYHELTSLQSEQIFKWFESHM